MSAETPITYFWFATMAWPSARGPVTWSRWSTYTTADPVSRAEVLGWIFDLAREDGAPSTAGLTAFTLVPDQVTVPAQTAAVVASVLAEARAALAAEGTDRSVVLASVVRQLSGLEVAS